MILQADIDKWLSDKKQKIGESLNCRKKINLRQSIANIHDVDYNHHDDGM